MRIPILVVLLSLFSVSAFAQAADNPAAAATQTADTTVVPPASTAPPAETAPPSDSGGRKWKIGVGVHYMETVGDIKDAEGFDTSAINALLAAKMGLGLIAIEFDSEWSFDFGGSSKTLWMPQAFALVDLGLLYGGAGIGAGYLDQEWFDNPVYSLRAGVKLPLGRFGVDVNASYQFISTNALEEFDSDSLDSVTFGAILWF